MRQPDEEPPEAERSERERSERERSERERAERERAERERSGGGRSARERRGGERPVGERPCEGRSGGLHPDDGQPGGEQEPDVRCYAVSHPGGPVRLPQDPAWHQLVYAVRGVLTVDTPLGTWVVPPHRAAWVPAGVTHRLVLSGRTTLRTLYLQRALPLLPPLCRVVDVSPLVRELILEAVRSAPLWMAEPAHARLIGVLADQLATLPEVALRLPVPRDPRAATVVALLRADPALDVPVEVLAHRANASRRTLERAFRAETGMSVGQWRRRLRMLEALRLLAAGESATSVATQVGYATPSAFGAAFRAELGGTPARWFTR